MDNYIQESGLVDLEGKTIKSLRNLSGKAAINHIITLSFTDGTDYTFLECTTENICGDDALRKAFVVLWDKANGTEHYDKSEWNKFISLLAERGVRLY